MGAAPAITPTLPDDRAPSRLRELLRRRKRVLLPLVAVATIGGFVAFVLPQLTGLSSTARMLRSGDPWWFALAVGLEALSLASYVTLFQTVFSCHGARIGWRESYQINLAGVVATKLFAAAGAGGVALTVWALRASGLQPRTIARRMLSFELLLYSVFAGALLVAGVGLRTGLLSGHAPWTLTVVPAILGGSALLIAFGLRKLPRDIARRRQAMPPASRARRILRRLASAVATLREARTISAEVIRSRDAGLLGAVGYWAFDIATLWACLHAFGSPPTVGVIVIAYFLGQLANALPLPGGIGGVEGGMIGVLIAFGTPASLALLGVLSYRAISFWLPTLPGGIAYVRLRRTVAAWRAEHAEALAHAEAV